MYFRANSRNELGANIWKHLLEEANSLNKGNSNKLAKVCNKLCEEAVKRDHLGRCMSMIVIQFENMSSCLAECADLQLPYVKTGEYGMSITKE